MNRAPTPRAVRFGRRSPRGATAYSTERYAECRTSDAPSPLGAADGVDTVGKIRTAETAAIAARVNGRTTFTIQSACLRMRSPSRPFPQHDEEHPSHHVLDAVSSLAVSRAGLDRLRPAQPRPSEVSATRRRSSISATIPKDGHTANAVSSHATEAFHSVALADAKAPTASSTAPGLESTG
jgi:hypothetical protein